MESSVTSKSPDVVVDQREQRATPELSGTAKLRSSATATKVRDGSPAYPLCLFLVLLALSAVAAVPETVVTCDVPPRYRPQRIRVAGHDRAGYAVAAASAFTAFAVFGLFTSLAPSFVAGSLHHPGRANRPST
jgi:hypothetical protein